MKKLLALVVAMMMVLALSSAVFATPVTTGSITVESPVAGEHYAAYKIFDLEYIATSNYAYTINASSPWFAAVQSYAGITLTASTDHAGTYVVTTNSNFSAAAFAAHLKAQMANITPTPTPEGADTVAVEGQNIVWSNLPLGYYFVTSTVGALCSLTSTDYNAIVHDKNEAAPFEKTADDTSVEVGQVVHFTITGEVPATTGYTIYTWRVTDTMSTGLDFVEGSVVVKIGDTVYTPTASELVNTANGFVLNLEMVGRDWAPGTPITITYNGVVTEDAVVLDEATNTATLDYSNNPNDSTSFEHETEVVKVYTADIIIDKTNAGGDKLSGADFVLYKLVEDADNPGTYIKYYYTYDAVNDVVGWTTNYANATHSITNAQGAASFIGLEEGDYYIEEVAAPYGYNLLTAPVQVHVNANATVHADVTQPIVNNTGSELPETGGIGTTIFYVIGGLMMAAAVVLLATRKKMSVED